MLRQGSDTGQEAGLPGESPKTTAAIRRQMRTSCYEKFYLDVHATFFQPNMSGIVPHELLRRVRIELFTYPNTIALPSLEFIGKQGWRLDWLHLGRQFIIRHNQAFDLPGTEFTDALLRLRDVKVVEMRWVRETEHSPKTGGEEYARVVGMAISEMTSRAREVHGGEGSRSDEVQRQIVNDTKVLKERIRALMAEEGVVFTYERRRSRRCTTPPPADA